MPFEDEVFAHGVVITPHRSEWAIEGRRLVERLRTLVPAAVAVEHIGSTSVPGLPAKDCLDATVLVSSLHVADLAGLSGAGFRERPERWNRLESLGGAAFPKRVFAPPVGERPVNVHVRVAGSPTARYALLFRDYLRADPQTSREWGEFKDGLAAAVPDLARYGQLKAAAMPLLMAGAEKWASSTGWVPAG